MPESTSTYETGQTGEEIAASYLQKKGYRLMDTNYRYERAEVDLVCFEPAERYEQGGELVFVEVKLRRGLGFGRPEEAVSEEKQQQIIKATRAYLYERQLEGAPMRFDVVSILWEKGRAPEIEHFENAFTL